MIDPMPDGCASGQTYEHERDHARLAKQREAVWKWIRGGEWWMLWELQLVTNAPEASISARLRDFRKPKFGGHTIERRYVSDGLWEYRLAPKEVTP